MKKTLFAISAIAVLLGFTACTSENETLEPQASKIITLKAYTEETTRTALSGDDTDGYKVVWSDGDKIVIGTNEFTLSEGKETTSGTFTGNELTAGEYTAYYPTTYDGTNWPTAQTYTAGNITGSPMSATFTYTTGEEPSLSFKNEGGILRLNLKGEAKVTSIKISATNLTNPITLNCGSTGVELNTTTATPFHIAVPGADDPGTAYSGLKIEITDNTGAVCTKTLKSDKTITVQRSKITDITLTAGSFEHAYVEIAGTKWATVNVGYVNGVEAEGSDETYGYYYTYDNALQAAASWGSNWVLPTKEQWEALINTDNCTWSWQTDYSFGGKNMKGYLVTDKKNGNSIFLPAAGGYIYSIFGQGISGDYWSSTSDDSENAYELCLEGELRMDNSSRDCGFSVRAVLKEAPATKGTAKATISGHDVDVNWVQLWENGPKFAEYNVGAESAAEYGGYYCWGSSINKDPNEAYKSGTDALTGEYDTATALWGSKWRMPTSDEFSGLLSNCDSEWTTVEGLKGRKYTGRGSYSSNSIFLPAAGFYAFGTSLHNVDSAGNYWSSTPDVNNAKNAYQVNFSSYGPNDHRVKTDERKWGYPVRAVLK